MEKTMIDGDVTMKTRSLMLITLSLIAGVMIPFPVAAGFTGGSVVQAVLFYSPSCPHCHQVATECLEPMLADYGDQLEIVAIDTSQPSGSELYHAAVERYEIPSGRRGVPTMVVGDVVLVGSREIPDRFPTIVEEGLAAGGISWPDIPGLAQQLAQMQSGPALTPTPEANTSAASASATDPRSTTGPAPSPSPNPALAVLDTGGGEVPGAKDQAPPSDPLGFALAGVVSAGMALSFGFSCVRISRPNVWQRIVQVRTWDQPRADWARGGAIPLLALVGLAVASYLAYVEITHVPAVCGPVGDCNVVQTSAYALFLGIPVAVWGVLFYLAVLALWAGHRYLVGRLAHLSLLGLLGLTLFGALFSIYLTCLELFAIRAICSWCLTSALITTILMLLVTRAVASLGHGHPPRAEVHLRKQGGVQQ
jgi:uncharacterized membrane protein/glutaredoxin